MQRIDQVDYLSENYELKFTNSSEIYNKRRKFSFIDETPVKREEKVYEYQPNDYKETEDPKYFTQYYVLKEIDERVNDKPVYFPKRVVREGTFNCNPTARENMFDFFDLQNTKEILRSKNGNEKESFVYVNGPLKGTHVSPDIDIFHVQKNYKKKSFGLIFIFLYKETEDRIEAHPVQVKTVKSIKANKLNYDIYHSKNGKQTLKDKLEKSHNRRDQVLTARSLSNLSIFAEQQPPAPEIELEQENTQENTIEITDVVSQKEPKKRTISTLFNEEQQTPIEPENKKQKQNINMDEEKKQKIIAKLKEKQNKEARDKFRQQERYHLNNEKKESTKILSGAQIGVRERINKISKI